MTWHDVAHPDLTAVRNHTTHCHRHTLATRPTAPARRRRIVEVADRREGRTGRLRHSEVNWHGASGASSSTSGGAATAADDDDDDGDADATTTTTTTCADIAKKGECQTSASCEWRASDLSCIATVA
jgi:hypothetical protein